MVPDHGVKVSPLVIWWHSMEIHSSLLAWWALIGRTEMLFHVRNIIFNSLCGFLTPKY